MALAIPDVTLLTASGANITAILTAIKAYYDGSPAGKWNIKANGASADAFTLVPAAAGEDFEINLREKDATTGRVLIDPLENITDPGTAGDPGTAPTLTDSTEDSGEHEALEIAGTESTDFYLIELDDCLIVLFMDSGETHNPYIWMMGRVLKTFFDDGSNGDNYIDGLGFLCGTVDAITTTTAGPFISSNTSSANRVRSGQTSWNRPGCTYEPSTGDLGDVDGAARPRPMIMTLLDIDSFNDSMVGWSKYVLRCKTSRNPGARLDGGAGSDCWVHVYLSDTSNNLLIPWDRTVTPAF